MGGQVTLKISDMKLAERLGMTVVAKGSLLPEDFRRLEALGHAAQAKRVIVAACGNAILAWPVQPGAFDMTGMRQP